MTRPAPAMAAPWMQLRPTPPQPITATVEPGSTLAVLNTAPTPVVTPQPISAARSRGMSLRIFTSACSWISICSAKRRQVEELVHRRAGVGQPRRVAGAAPGASLLVAQRQVAGEAVLAVAAVDRQAGDHVVARLHVADLVADRLDDAGRLVAEHGGQRVGVLALHEVQVGVAQPGRGGADQHLARAGRADLHLVDLEAPGHGLEEGSTHDAILTYPLTRDFDRAQAHKVRAGMLPAAIAAARRSRPLPAETHVERGTPMDRQQVFELIRDRLADILEIEPGDHLRGSELRRRPRRRLAGPDRAGRGPRGGAQRALGRASASMTRTSRT